MKRKKQNNIVFITSIVICILIVLFGYFYHENLVHISEKVMKFVSNHFGWLYLISIILFMIFLLSLCFSKYGKIKLGKKNDKPEYSNFSWYSMLFCGGTGIGLIFWSIAEPLSHYASPPTGIEAGTVDAINFSIRTCFLHWGVTGWACYAIIGLALAYFIFKKGEKGLISNLLKPIVKKEKSIVYDIIDIFAVVVSVVGVATSLGLGISQVSGGLNYLFNIPSNNITYFIIISLITIIFLISAITGMKKGIKILSNINSYLAIILLILVFLLGPKIAILNTLVNGIGQHIQNLIGDLSMINSFSDNDWIMNWRVFYYAWFIAWTPFIGMFIARISKGRTIREFIIGTTIIPSIFNIIWFAVFGTIALNTTTDIPLEEISKIASSPETSVFIIFEKFPFSTLISLLIIMLLLLFFITSADSATYSLSMMSSNGAINPSNYKKIVWAVISALIAFILLSAGSLKPLQTISIAFSLPFLIIMLLVCIAFIKEIKKGHNEK